MRAFGDFSHERKVTPAERPQDAPLRFAGVTANSKNRFFSTPFFFCLRTKETGWPPKKIRQRGASITSGFTPLTAGNSFVKTQSFYFRWRCAGADLRYWCSLALAQQQAKYLSRSLPTARESITSFIGAAAGNSGFVCPVTPRRSVERCIY